MEKRPPACRSDDRDETERYDRRHRDRKVDREKKCRCQLKEIGARARNPRSRSRSRYRPLSVDVVDYGDLQRYDGPEIEPRCWMDVEAVKRRMLDEIKAWNKVPILSERNARDLLLKWSDPELPEKLADRSIDSLESGELNLLYWRWLSAAASETGLDERLRSRVTLSGGGGGKAESPRFLWAMPTMVVAEEARYALPLIDCFKRGDGGQCTYFTLDGDQNCVLQLRYNKKCFDFLEQSYTSDFQFVMINYLVFDPVVPNWVIRVCFETLMQKLNLSAERDEDETVTEASADTNRDRFKLVVEYFLKMSIEVRGAEGGGGAAAYTIPKSRGIPGGSCFTHLIRTMSNFLMTFILIDFVFHEKPYSFRFHGSKCLMVFDSKFEASLCAFSQCAYSYFGIIVDSDRTCITATIEDLHALKYCCDTD